MLSSSSPWSAGLSYSVNNTTTGILITAAGYSHKLPVLIEAVLDAIVSFEPQESRFQVRCSYKDLTLYLQRLLQA